MLFVLAFAAFVAAWVALERNNELVVLEWNGRALRLVRGNDVPVRLAQEFAEILSAANVSHARLRVTSRSHSARLVAPVDDETLLRLRAALQKVPMAQLRDAPAPSRFAVERAR